MRCSWLEDDTYFRLAALLLTLPLPPPLPLLLLPLSESVGDAALTLELLPKGGVGAVRGMFMRSKIESFELADCDGTETEKNGWISGVDNGIACDTFCSAVFLNVSLLVLNEFANLAYNTCLCS